MARKRSKSPPVTPRETRRMVKLCGWKGKKRVKRQWLELPPGTPYADAKCTKLAGKAVPMRKGRGEKVTWVVKGCATPKKPRKGTASKRSVRYTCQGAFVLQDLAGRHAMTMPKSVVRERIRSEQRPGICDRQATGYKYATLADLAVVERDAKGAGIHPWDFVGDYEFVHRKGAGPCCPYSPNHATADKDKCWEDLRARVRRRAAKAGLSSTREIARRRARVIREGGDVGDAPYRETLRGHEKAMAKRYGVGGRHRNG